MLEVIYKWVAVSLEPLALHVRAVRIIEVWLTNDAGTLNSVGMHHILTFPPMRRKMEYKSSESDFVPRVVILHASLFPIFKGA